MLDLIKQYSDLIVPFVIGVLTLYSKTIIKWTEALFAEFLKHRNLQIEHKRKVELYKDNKLKSSNNLVKFIFFLRDILIENRCAVVAILEYKEINDQFFCFCRFDYIKEEYHNRIESPRKVYDGILMDYENESYKELIKNNVLVYNDLEAISCQIKKERLLTMGMSAYIELLVNDKSIALFYDQPIDISNERLFLIRQEFESKIKYI